MKRIPDYPGRLADHYQPAALGLRQSGRPAAGSDDGSNRKRRRSPAHDCQPHHRLNWRQRQGSDRC